MADADFADAPDETVADLVGEPSSAPAAETGDLPDCDACTTGGKTGGGEGMGWGMIIAIVVVLLVVFCLCYYYFAPASWPYSKASGDAFMSTRNDFSSQTVYGV